MGHAHGQGHIRVKLRCFKLLRGAFSIEEKQDGQDRLNVGRIGRMKKNIHYYPSLPSPFSSAVYALQNQEPSCLILPIL